MAGQVKVKLRKNDKVQVISGRERGKTGASCGSTARRAAPSSRASTW